MTQVSFYPLGEEHQSAMLKACFIAAECYQNKQRVSVLCADNEAAKAFDNLLWQQPLDRFVPHNLFGEGPRGGAPVEIVDSLERVRKGVTLIVLNKVTIDTANHYSHIIDFVPVAEDEKHAARERYKFYQRAGCTMRFVRSDD